MIETKSLILCMHYAADSAKESMENPVQEVQDIVNPNADTIIVASSKS